MERVAILDGGGHRLEAAWHGPRSTGARRRWSSSTRGSAASRRGATSRARVAAATGTAAPSSTAAAATARAEPGAAAAAAHVHARRGARACCPTSSTRPASSERCSSGTPTAASIALIYAGERSGRGVRGVVREAPHVFVEDVSRRGRSPRRARLRGRPTLRERLARHHGTNVDGAFYGWADAWLDPGFRRWNIEASCRACACPSLVIQGEDDAYGTLAQVDAIERGAAGPVERACCRRAGTCPIATGRTRSSRGAVAFLEERWAISRRREPRPHLVCFGVGMAVAAYAACEPAKPAISSATLRRPR